MERLQKQAESQITFVPVQCSSKAQSYFTLYLVVVVDSPRPQS